MLSVPVVSEAVPGVVRAGQNDTERILNVLTRAFAADPPSRWLYPDEADYLSHFPTFIRALGGVALERGTAFVSDDYFGTALWLAPDASPDEELLMRVSDTVAPHKSAEMGAVIDEMGRYHPREPHWYLPFIGVMPFRQARGIGAALLRLGLADSDRAGLPTYLESTNPRNQALYERHGFEAIGEIKVGSCPPIVPMLRRPR
jgi:ribosomal protein S18 acetylase RimI-like enzyme